MSTPQVYSFMAFDAATGERIGTQHPAFEDTRLREDHVTPRVSRTGWYLFATDRLCDVTLYLERGEILCKEPPCCEIGLGHKPVDFPQHIQLHNVSMRQYLRRHPEQLDLVVEHRVAS